MEKAKGNGKQEGLSAEDRAFSLFAEMMIEKIESIRENWQKPWFTEGAMPWPKNLSGREYNGVNALMLMFFCEKNGYKIPRFCTFNQLRRMNEEAEGKGLPRVSVQKGSQSFPVIFPTFTCVHKDTKGKIKYEDYRQLSKEEQTQYKVYPGRQVFNVFNVAQTNLQEARPELWAKLEAEVTPPKIEAGEDYSFEPVDKMIRDNLWICPIVPKLQDRAYFSPSENRIVVPGKAQFKDGESFYGTVFHEMIHSTGVEGVLDRLKPAGFSSDEYAREELVAELGAALVAQRYGMNRHIKEDSCAYIKGWLDNLKKSPQFIKTTLTDVKKATAIITQKIDHIAQKIDKEQIQTREFEEDKKNDLLDRNDMEQVNKPEKKNYRQLDLSFDEPVAETNYDVLLEPESPRKEVEFANVQRVFEESKAFQFAAPNKIRSPRDVAYIFKQLETAAVENAFAVLVKDGRPTVLHLGMGCVDATFSPIDPVVAADKKIKADKIYFIHNHPSGNIKASIEDMQIFQKWHDFFGNRLQPGIIINTRSGLYGEYGHQDSMQTTGELLDDGEKRYPIKLYSFSKLVFDKDYREINKMRGAHDVAQFISNQRLGTRPKLSYMVLSNNSEILANIHTPYSDAKGNNMDELKHQIIQDAVMFGGKNVITYGSSEIGRKEIARLCSEIRKQDIRMLDYVQVLSNVENGEPCQYMSANDEGWFNQTREPVLSYGKERKEDNPVQGLKDYTREEIKDLVKNHIETVMEEAGLDAQVIGVEIHGSRGRGDARPDSDLDVVVEYEGDMKEDGMFNLLNEDALRIDGVRVDVNPIRKQETGTLQEYMERSRAYDKENPERSNRIVPVISAEIEAVNRRFNQELRLQVAGQLRKGHVYQLGMPSAILISAGIPDLPIEMASARLLHKSNQENHPFELSEVMNLPQAIQNPLAVFRSATHIGSNVILTELNQGDKNFVVAIQTNKEKGRLQINDVRSVHPRVASNITHWINEGLMEYAAVQPLKEWISNKIKTREYLNSSTPAEVRKSLVLATKVIENFENPKIEMAEKLSKQRSNSAEVRKLSDHATKVVQNFVPERKQAIVKNRKRGRGL